MHVLYFNRYHQTVLREVVTILVREYANSFKHKILRDFSLVINNTCSFACSISLPSYTRNATQRAHPVIWYHLSSFRTGHSHAKALATTASWSKQTRCTFPHLSLPSSRSVYSQSPCVCRNVSDSRPLLKEKPSLPQAGPVKRGPHHLHLMNRPGRALGLYQAHSTVSFSITCCLKLPTGT